jgi:hypothetical protein
VLCSEEPTEWAEDFVIVTGHRDGHVRVWQVTLEKASERNGFIVICFESKHVIVKVL